MHGGLFTDETLYPETSECCDTDVYHIAYEDDTGHVARCVGCHKQGHGDTVYNAVKDMTQEVVVPANYLIF